MNAVYDIQLIRKELDDAEDAQDPRADVDLKKKRQADFAAFDIALAEEQPSESIIIALAELFASQMDLTFFITQAFHETSSVYGNSKFLKLAGDVMARVEHNNRVRPREIKLPVLTWLRTKT